MKELRLLFSSLNKQLAKCDGDPERVIVRHQQILREIRGKARAPRVVIKTLRHQCRANMAKSGYYKDEIAAVMGHVAMDTQTTYGRTKRGRKVQRRVQVSDDLVTKVRNGSATDWKLRNNVPLERAPSTYPTSEYEGVGHPTY